jgi:hypothetical protein
MREKIFGQASDFYRVRLIEVKEEEPAELSWEEGASYFPPPVEESKSAIKYRLEVVELDTEKVYPFRSFVSLEEAKKLLTRMDEELGILTKNEFEKKYGFLPFKK